MLSPPLRVREPGSVTLRLHAGNPTVQSVLRNVLGKIGCFLPITLQHALSLWYQARSSDDSPSISFLQLPATQAFRSPTWSFYTLQTHGRMALGAQEAPLRLWSPKEKDLNALCLRVFIQAPSYHLGDPPQGLHRVVWFFCCWLDSPCPLISKAFRRKQLILQLLKHGTDQNNQHSHTGYSEAN